MATESKLVSMAPLKGSNYSTWKVQCKMALMRDGLWGIIEGTEVEPHEPGDRLKFLARRDKALATIVLMVDPSLLYLIGEPEDPIAVWKKLADQFQRKTWANKLVLRRKLHSLRLRDGGSVQEHVRAMTELFNELSVVGDQVEEDDRVVYLLASLPDSYNTLVTALEANEDVPKMEVVTERLLYEESKLKDRKDIRIKSEGALAIKRSWPSGTSKGLRCYNCNKFGHIQRHCRENAQVERNNYGVRRHEREKIRHKANKVEVEANDSESDAVGLTTNHILSAKNHLSESCCWIVDSGATCHISHNKELFVEFQELKKFQKVSLGDGHTLEATGKGVVALEMMLPNEKTRNARLFDVLYVPGLSYNLISISKVTGAGKRVNFAESQCQIMDEKGSLVGVATKTGNLYYLDCKQCTHQINTTSVDQGHESKERIWHRRFGHLGVGSLRDLVKNGLVTGLDYNVSKAITFCEPCVEGKLHRSQFPNTGRKRANEILGLVHTDVCGKINAKSLSGAEYF